MKNSIFILTILISFRLLGQNIVPNPSFESNPGCPYQINDINNYASDWVVYDPTPDYFNSCATISSLGVPSNFAGWQYPATGNAYCGGYVYIEPGIAPANNREAIGTHLLTPMIIGQKYYVSLKVSLANYSRYSINKIGLLFTTRPYCEIYNPPPTNCTSPSIPIATPNFAHVYSNAVISDTANWTLITGTLIADSAYSYVAWGNFFSDSLTTAIDRGGAGHLTYFFVDDICVSNDSTTCWNPMSIKESSLDHNISIYPNPLDNETTIEFNNPYRLPSQLILYDTKGRLILAVENINNDKVTIRKEGLISGLYFFQVVNKSGLIGSGKLIVE